MYFFANTFIKNKESRKSYKGEVSESKKEKCIIVREKLIKVRCKMTLFVSKRMGCFKRKLVLRGGRIIS